MLSLKRKILLGGWIAATTLVPNFLIASTTSPLVYNGWIPYWKKIDGVSEATQHLSQLQEISPFAYEVKSDGTLLDRMKIDQDPWIGLLRAARTNQTKIIPTISSADGALLRKLLLSRTVRNTHIENIMRLIKENNFDGVDIDYESKGVETRPYFSRFITDLSKKLHSQKKILSCTVEPRTPIRSRFIVPPKSIEYANDYRVLNLYCDEVRIMTYDQTRIDIRLNQKKGTAEFYAPVADIEWVKKVILQARQTIRSKKIMMGVSTFGYEYIVASTAPFYQYSRLRSLTYREATDLAQKVGIKPVRNSAGELSFTYPVASTTRLVWFDDAESIAEKIQWARRYRLRGVSLFKIDGAGDSAFWEKVN